MSKLDILNDRILSLENQLRDSLNYVTATRVDEILGNERFWDNFSQTCNKILKHVKQTKSFKSQKLVTKWLQCFKVIIKKDTKLRNRLIDGPIKIVFYDLLDVEYQFPPWFLKSFFNSIFEFIQFDDNILSSLYKTICNCTNFNMQRSFIEIITANFDNNSIYENIIKNKILNKELQTLFTNILGEEDDKTIRSFLYKLNNNENPLRIFSFKSDEIKLNGLLLVKDTWVDINTLALTITFECKQSYLSLDENSQNLPEIEDKYDIITIKMSHISCLRYISNKSPDCNDGHELTLELIKPCRAYHETSAEFLKNYRIIVMYVSENTDRFNNFIFDYFTNKLENLPEDLNRSNFELNLFEKIDDAMPASPASTVLSSTDTLATSLNTTRDEVVSDSQHESFSSDMNEKLNCSETEYVNNMYNSTIMQTPKPHEDHNISVDESQITEESSVSATLPSEYEQLNYESSILVTPKPRSTNFSVAASYPSQVSIPTTQEDSGTDKKNTQPSSKCVARTGLSGLPMSVPETQYISVRTPNTINQSVTPEMINLVSPELLLPSLRIQNEVLSDKSQINKNSKVVQTDIIPEELSNPSQTTQESQDDVPLARGLANKPQNEDNQHSQVSNRVLKISNEELNTSSCSGVSSTSSRGRKRRRKENDPNYSCHSPSLTNKSKNVKNGTPKKKTSKAHKKKLQYDKDLDDDSSEFEDTSFFSDKENNENEFICTKTRVVKKPVPFQYNSDSEISRRKLKAKKNIPPIQEQDMLPPPVKRIKTILPLRRPEDTPSCSAAGNNVNSGLIRNRRNTIDVIANKIKKNRRITNAEKYDQLDEQPLKEVFKISVPTLKNKNQSPLTPNQQNNQGVPSTSHGCEVLNNTPKNMDMFDKLKRNIPITQNMTEHRKIGFFSSSSGSSPICQTDKINSQSNHINPIDHEEILPSQEQINNAENLNISDIIPEPVAGQSNLGNKISPKNDGKVLKVAKRVRKPKEPKLADTKAKRAPRKKKNDAADTPVSKLVRRKKKETVKVSNEINQNVATTSRVNQNVRSELPNINSNSPNLDSQRCVSLSSTSEENSCNYCGAAGANIAKEIRETMKRLCELCVISLPAVARNEYCIHMENFFRDLRDK